MSYFYMKRMKKATLHALLEKMKEIDAWCMLDSGAHTFFSAHGQLSTSLFKHKQGTTQKTDAPEEYMRKYHAWLKEYGEFFNEYVELDIGAVKGVGMGKVRKWRDDMWADEVYPVPVYHKSIEYNTLVTRGLLGGESGWDAQNDAAPQRQAARMLIWEEWCKNPNMKYLGLAGGWPRDDYLPLLAMSNKYQKPVHGFAMTNKEVFRNLSFYSVDSTSWLAGQQYGVTYHLKGNELKTADSKNKDIRRTNPWIKDMCEKYHISHDELVSDDPYAVNRYNAAVWCEYQTVIDMQHRNDPVVKALDEGPQITALAMPEKRELDQTAKIGRWCDQCYIADKCPFFKQGSECTVPFTPVDAAGQPTTGDLGSMLRQLMTQAFDRLQFALATERVKGGLLDPEVSKELKNFVGLCGQIKAMTDDRDTIKIEAKGSGIIAKMFGGYGRAGGTSPAESLKTEDNSPLDQFGESGAPQEVRLTNTAKVIEATSVSVSHPDPEGE